MKAFVLFLLVCSVFPTPEGSEIDLTLAIDASGVSMCVETCLSEFFYTAAQLIYLQNPMERLHEMCRYSIERTDICASATAVLQFTFEDLCSKEPFVISSLHGNDKLEKYKLRRSYENASKCINSHKETCYQNTVFDVALSGIEELCNEREQDVMDYKDCLEVHSEVVLKSCNKKCLFTEVLMMLSGRGNTKGLQKLPSNQRFLQKDLAWICTTFGCMSSCVAGDLNTHCSPVGTIIVKSLMKPFFTFSTIFEEIGPRSKVSVYRQFPPQCYYLADIEEVNGVANGKAPSKEMPKNPEEAVLKDITAKEELKKKKKAELEKLFLTEAQQAQP